MNPEETQMTPEEAKASLGLATHLQQQVAGLGGSPQEAPQTQQDGQGEEQIGQADISTELKDMENRIMGEIESLKKESPLEEIRSIKKELETLLADESNGQEKD